MKEKRPILAGAALAGPLQVFPGVYRYRLTDTGLAASLTLPGTRLFKDPVLH